jgi:hypothetical protein
MVKQGIELVGIKGETVVENAVAPDDSNKRSSKYSRSLFQILVSLDTISD